MWITSLDLNAVRDVVGTYISKNRLAHCDRVVETVQRLCTRWGLDPAPLILAAFTHDIAKDLTPADFAARQIDLPAAVIEGYGIYPRVFHAFAGPSLITKLWAITDEAVLSPVRYHTTGRAAMSPGEKVLFVADAIEPGRSYAWVPGVTSLAELDLNAACFALTVLSIGHLVRERRAIHPATVDCYNDTMSQLSQWIAISPSTCGSCVVQIGDAIIDF